MLDTPSVIFIMGPTASGKTDLAVELVRRFPCDIISVDSAMVYRGMDIGTAKPGPTVLAQAPHRLIDILDPAVAYSAAQFRADAHREIDAIHAAGRIPLLVGGTMLYFRALQHGLSALPSADAEVRGVIDAEARERGWAALHQRLAQIDPAAAARIHPNDPQRIQRALEVYQLTGRPLSSFFTSQMVIPAAPALPGTLIKLVMAPSDRAVMQGRIETRFHQMLEQGLIREVEALYQRGDLSRELPSIRSVGYRQVWDYLSDELSYSAMIERATSATRQLAKRQLTWLRREEEVQWFDSLQPMAFNSVIEYIEVAMKT
ncbi:MAG: tRNA (adenosine(37)-N6)-dimethylallyltransferase MiaA [Pseudomonadota bacterium]